MTTLVCACGKRLRAAGAVPGRLGRCPACGQTLRVPDDVPASSPAPAAQPFVEPSPKAATEQARPSTFVTARHADAPRASSSRRGWWGVIRPPTEPESRFRESLRYPFWDGTGVSVLVCLPPVLWLTSLPVFGLLPVILGSGGLIWVLAPFALGMSFFFALTLGYALVFLNQVVISSALGEVQHPRLPDGDFSSLLGGVGRWAWAGLIGFVVGGIPAIAYWISCGDVDLFDQVIIAELLAVGAAYTQMGLVATLLHDDFRAANPITVTRAIRRVGFSYLRLCLLSGAAVLVAVIALSLVFRAPNVLLAAFGLWVFWVFALYEAMVVLRVLGLFYRRHAAALGWFPERPRWGA